jgi:hypothetical protein
MRANRDAFWIILCISAHTHAIDKRKRAMMQRKKLTTEPYKANFQNSTIPTIITSNSFVRFTESISTPRNEGGAAKQTTMMLIARVSEGDKWQLSKVNVFVPLTRGGGI